VVEPGSLHRNRLEGEGSEIIRSGLQNGLPAFQGRGKKRNIKEIKQNGDWGNSRDWRHLQYQSRKFPWC
jgi:hypothetical protein